MKKKYLILAITAFTFFAGISNNLKAQEADTTLSFGKYLVKTPWVLTYALNFFDDDGQRSPFKFKPHKNPTPFKFAIDKDIYGFRNWKYTDGSSAQLAIASTSLKFRLVTTVDLNLKYDLLKKYDKIDLYLIIGGGFSNTARVKAMNSQIVKYRKDNFLNFNFGGGLTYWAFDNVGINLQSTGKLATFWGKNHYAEYSAGLVFRIGGVKAKKEQPYTYIRSKEAEDALIHLREHINQ